ncbi:MAG: S8 family peptidase [Saprospiraceae bacterium]
MAKTQTRRWHSHVINNSWGCPPVEGCNPDNFSLMETAVNALRAAGVVVVVSAGNSGPNCHTVNNPAAMFEGSFAVGASRSNDTIANFSSRGSVAIDSSFRLKPNVVAPGVGVRSAIRNGGYATWNGTSMAGPHVAGAVALIISAAPHLAGEVDSIETILEHTAIPMLSDQDCTPFQGMAVPNTAYGYGRIDVYAAVERAMQTVSVVQTSQEKVAVYPNPTDGRIQLRLPDDIDFRFLLFSTDGRLLATYPLNESTSIDLSFYPTGVYYYTLIGDNGYRQQDKVVLVR